MQDKRVWLGKRSTKSDLLSVVDSGFEGAVGYIRADAVVPLVDAARTMLESLDGSPGNFAGMLAAHRKLEAAYKVALAAVGAQK